MHLINILSISNALFIAAICQLCVFIIFLVLNRKGIWRLNLILAFVLLFQVVPAISTSILYQGNELDLFPLAHIGNASGFLIGPLLFFYLRKYLSNRFFYLKIDIFHFAFFIIAFALFVSFAQSQDGNFTRRPIDMMPSLCLFLYTLAYSLFSLQLIIQHRKTPAAEQRSVFWPVFLFAGYLILLLGHFTIFFLWEVVPINQLSPITLDLYLMLSPYSLSMYFVIFILFTNILFLLALSGFHVINYQKKYKQSRLSAESKIRFEKKIREKMEKEQPYLDPLLSVDGMARSMGIPSREQSQIINECFAMKFSDYVNSFRVHEVVRLLEQCADDRTILDISLEAGFNSKSSFNSVFKKHIGLSPRDYLKSVGQNKRQNPGVAV